MPQDLTYVRTADLINELRRRDFRAVHKESIQTAHSRVVVSPDDAVHFTLSPEHFDKYIRRQLNDQLAAFLQKKLPIKEYQLRRLGTEYGLSVTIIASGEEPL